MGEPSPPARSTRDELEAFKIVALAQGLQIDDRIADALGGAAALTVHEYATTGGITLVLPEGVLVNAPFDAPFCARSPLELKPGVDGRGLVLRMCDAEVPVTAVLPLPGYLDALDDAGVLVSDIAMSHTDRIRVSPISGCAYDCQFCDLATVRYRPRPIDDILRAIDFARTDAALPTRHLLISGGSPPVRHASGQDYFEAVCLAIARHLREATAIDGSPFEVDIMMSARPDGPRFVERMVAAGVTGFSFNIEVYSDASARTYLPLKHKLSRGYLRENISAAVGLLGWGTAHVRSLIIPGLEPIEKTLAGVDWLASLGCSPVISPFRPAPGTALVDADPVAPSDLRRILDESRGIVRSHGVLLGPRCVDCQHNTLSFPWDLHRVSA
jgi:hypothetical protein